MFCSLSRSSFCYSCFGSLFFTLLLLLFTRHDFSMFPCAVFGTICLKPELASEQPEQLQQSLNIYLSSQEDFEAVAEFSATTEVLLSVSHLANRRSVGLHLQDGHWTHSKGKYLRQQGSLQPNSFMLVAVTGTVGSNTGCLVQGWAPISSSLKRVLEMEGGILSSPSSSPSAHSHWWALCISKEGNWLWYYERQKKKSMPCNYQQFQPNSQQPALHQKQNNGVQYWNVSASWILHFWTYGVFSVLCYYFLCCLF